MFVNITLRRKMRDERDHFNKSDLVHDDVAVCREGQPVLDDLQPSLRPNPDELLDGKCSPLSLVEVKRGSALIGRELQSVAAPEAKSVPKPLVEPRWSWTNESGPPW